MIKTDNAFQKATKRLSMPKPVQQNTRYEYLNNKIFIKYAYQSKTFRY